jgi:hypothetical protein
MANRRMTVTPIAASLGSSINFNTTMNALARNYVGTQAPALSGDTTESNRKCRVIGLDDVRSDSPKIIAVARRTAARHSALLEKLSQ